MTFIRMPLIAAIAALGLAGPVAADDFTDSVEAALEAYKDGDIKTMRARARKGALAADKAFGRVIFTDYTMSFIGCTQDEQGRFRAGQKAHGEARTALKAGDHAKALAAVQRRGSPQCTQHRRTRRREKQHHRRLLGGRRRERRAGRDRSDRADGTNRTH